MGYRGWVRLALEEPANALLYVRFVESDRGRLVIRELYIDGTETPDGEPIDGPSVADMPLEELEAWVNLDADIADWIRRFADSVSPVRLDVLASYFAFTGMGRRELRTPTLDWVRAAYIGEARAHGLEADGQPAYVTPPRRRVKSGGVDREPDAFTLGPIADVRVLLTEEFLDDVAHAYAAAVSRGESPGVAIAEQTGKPLATAQRWVLEARKRGMLPPGRTGVLG